MVMVAVPVGIFASNLIFGHFYDLQLKKTSSAASVCYGDTCFKTAFTIQAAIQLLAVATSVALFCYRMIIKSRLSRNKNR